MDDDVWNFNESGVRIGIAKNQYVFTQNGRQVFMPHRNNRELITLVEAISSSNNYIPPMVIIAAKTILEKWCD